MKLPADEQFRAERVRFALKLHCEDCALWDESRDACAHGFPTHEHRDPASREGTEDEVPVVFCKDFEVA